MARRSAEAPSTEEIKALAHRLRLALGMENIETIDFKKVLAKITDVLPDIQVEIVPNSKAREFAWVESDKLFVGKSVVDSAARDTRARFLLAHELAHLVLHHGTGLSRGPHDRSKEELEAAIFASEFLTPTALTPSSTVEEIQRKFRPSPMTFKRFVELKSADNLPIAPAARARPNIIGELAEHGYSEEELSELVVPKRTLARRRSDKELLTIEETDKALRLKRIAALAEQVFADRAKAYRWLRKPKRQLQDETPLAYLASENGARVIEEMLRRIEHGIFA
jgi:putative toxin-antitoxin system antitoxin component (TIGR02293 family)